MRLSRCAYRCFSVWLLLASCTTRRPPAAPEFVHVERKGSWEFYGLPPVWCRKEDDPTRAMPPDELVARWPYVVWPPSEPDCVGFRNCCDSITMLVGICLEESARRIYQTQYLNQPTSCDEAAVHVMDCWRDERPPPEACTPYFEEAQRRRAPPPPDTQPGDIPGSAPPPPVAPAEP